MVRNAFLPDWLPSDDQAPSGPYFSLATNWVRYLLRLSSLPLFALRQRNLNVLEQADAGGQPDAGPDPHSAMGLGLWWLFDADHMRSGTVNNPHG